MRIKLKSLASAIALGFALLAFGPAASSAQAAPFHGRGGSAHRSFAPNRYHSRAQFARPFRTFAPRAAFFGPRFGPRPYRLVRVFVYDPYPRWIYRRVYTTAYAGAYCPY